MTTIRLMTFNIRLALAMDGRNRWYKRRDLVFDVIQRSDPDIVGLQEVSPRQLAELLSAVPRYGVIADRSYGGQRSGTYGPILFDRTRLEPEKSGDYWLAPEPDGARTRGWDAAVPRICTWAVFGDRANGGRRFAIANSHFDQRGVQARVESARLVVSKLGELAFMPRLFTGDLNADERSDPVQILKEAGYRDTFRVLHPNAEALTFHSFRGRGVRSLGKIDYVFCDASWRVLDAGIERDGHGGRYPSDHFPVTAQLAYAT
jgi:endonuclease/exonuclease/phosphatase family metal-dependent hydrolase